MMNPNRKPDDVLKGLRKQQLKLTKVFTDLRTKGVGELPVKREKPSIPGVDFYPNLEKIKKAMALARVIEHMRHYPFPLEQFWGESEDGETPSEPWTTTLMAYDMTVFPDIKWSDNGATFSGEWLFDPNSYITEGILAVKGWVDVPTPFDWPIYEESPNHAQLAKTAAMTFNVPAPSCDCLVLYEAQLLIGLNCYFDADDWFFIASSLLCVQPDASAAMPSGVADFDRIEPKIQLAHESGPQIKSFYLSGSYPVKAGIKSRVHLGMHWNLSITNGCGGTCGGWDNFIIFRPHGSDVWGLKVTMVPL
jgi:hypothetical protein